VSGRLLAHFTQILFAPPSEASLQTIFGGILGGYFEQGFAPAIREMAVPIVKVRPPRTRGTRPEPRGPKLL